MIYILHYNTFPFINHILYIDIQILKLYGVFVIYFIICANQHYFLS
jgi:hypothetical protein